ncbi:hypothetical protein SAMD00019534_018820 [Acytostelium subglobosum LB1]|uniref:hypothetical protein n=1 Tax=Acytostelium subglobosum LB1 TaxID=1410327 RepID=UPI000644F636|nr:hypothetical protein SAMD00019534_018820 [Acytostelium subglobosum LB1]GAM18707.1 hypothetical protein SAMD00019534_018820 [Acytostelium subglobosum LB1]|eukprot:XP_012757927.1 hypothetical protein SAMD00019534_018820 [Acytostelium subglobosum LB1]
MSNNTNHGLKIGRVTLGANRQSNAGLSNINVVAPTSSPSISSATPVTVTQQQPINDNKHQNISSPSPSSSPSTISSSPTLTSVSPNTIATATSTHSSPRVEERNDTTTTTTSTPTPTQPSPVQSPRATINHSTTASTDVSSSNSSPQQTPKPVSSPTSPASPASPLLASNSTTISKPASSTSPTLKPAPVVSPSLSALSNRAAAGDSIRITGTHRVTSFNTMTGDALSAKDIYQLIAEQKLTDNDIWGGHPDLFPILFQFGHHFQSMADGDASAHVLSINLPASLSSCGDMRMRSYKISKKLTVAQTVNLVCRKEHIKDPRQFYLVTLMGCVLDNELLLSTYGFGTFFSSWELCLISRDAYLGLDSASSSSSDHPISGDNSGGEHIIDFKLPPLKQLQGLKKKRLKVDSTLTIGQFIDNICNKYKISDPERFSIITSEEYPLLMHRDATLAHYGLGSKMATMELSLVFNEFVPPYSLRNNQVPAFGHVTAGKPNTRQLRDTVVDLENRLHDSLALNESMVAKIKEVAVDAQRAAQDAAQREESLHRKIEHMDVEHNTLIQRIVDQVTLVKQNFQQDKESFQRTIDEMQLERTQLQQDKDGLIGDKARLEQDIDALNVKSYQERSSHTETVMKLNDTIDGLNDEVQSLNASIGERVQEREELTRALSANESILERVRAESQTEERRLRDMMESMEREKAEQKAAYERMMSEAQQKYERTIGEAQQKYERMVGDVYQKLEMQKQNEEQRMMEITHTFKQEIDALAAKAAAPPPPPPAPEPAPPVVVVAAPAPDMFASSMERDNLMSTIKKLTDELKDREESIKTIYPRKVEALEQTIKRLEAKMAESDKESKQNKQQVALKSLDIDELKRQLEQLKFTSKEQQQQTKTQLDQTTATLREEEKKLSKAQNDVSTLRGELEAERYKCDQTNKSLNDTRQAKLELEKVSRAREQALLLEIEELKKPKPPPLPSFKTATPRKNRVTDADDPSISAETLSETRGTLKSVAHLPSPPREHGISTIADLLYVSMQKRFNAMNQVDVVVLDDYEDDDDSNDQFFD